MTGKGAKAKIKETKVSKIKELAFTVMEKNYLDFLMEMLSKHGKMDYHVSEKKRYTFKYTIHLAKTYVNFHNEAMDVNNAKDFSEMAKKISEIKPEKV
ncbi:hypothetical protein SCLCIDRAFT_114694 [Scleroderma citrinum Foug A]|uniref:Uncharacterized protein n=1 Tax=Scleroderma citrinum Foug A TaxID=1036808 RepID=A0A0C2ZST0_9AGAM|nr:hypothetical protein SCLCIDRAFT_114694 [Scleroderma citrinum Foug A]